MSITSALVQADAGEVRHGLNMIGGQDERGNLNSFIALSLTAASAVGDAYKVGRDAAQAKQGVIDRNHKENLFGRKKISTKTGFLWSNNLVMFMAYTPEWLILTRFEPVLQQRIRLCVQE